MQGGQSLVAMVLIEGSLHLPETSPHQCSLLWPNCMQRLLVSRCPCRHAEDVRLEATRCKAIVMFAELTQIRL
jgi:hypothetical protein